MKEISITVLIEELQKEKDNGNFFVFFKGTLMTEDNSIIVSTEKQM